MGAAHDGKQSGSRRCFPVGLTQLVNVGHTHEIDVLLLALCNGGAIRVGVRHAGIAPSPIVEVGPLVNQVHANRSLLVQRILAKKLEGGLLEHDVR